MQLKHNEMDLGSFWITAQREYPDILTKAIHVLLPFATTYLYESTFSSLILIKNNQRSGLESVEQELRVCLPGIQPRIKTLCAHMQAHHSH